ncbi:AAA-like domain-containing protein [Lusitaniella coriacea LEGE 07157]|uniref:AAA-like domain-containing protein n=1 Tax=Lusitaniella coriacea LEGE 07157 TaxID=945747 RepID=A0A8J7DXN3_9CYAN|nr:AAA-like domain-containing protein [Lusitaniella coriacea]MBE9117264.1 AAA-like domain-containing protein [Lusitaniella coriacea LEGE 07157]
MAMTYYFSGTLHEDDPTYVKRQADDELFESLASGQFCYVLSSRQTGKSSLRVRTMSRLKQSGFACSVIDVSKDATEEVKPSQWYANLISTLTHEFDLDFDVGSWYRQQDWFSPLSRFREFIESVLLTQIQENIVIFIDEIDSLLSLPFPTDDFFALIRACHNTRVDKPIYKRLTFCLLGVATPSDLIRDKKRTPFNIGKGIELTRFTFEEARGSLTQGLAQKVDNPERVLSEVLKWTGGQPFLTQKLCQLIIDKTQSRQPDIKQLAQTYVIENWESQDIPPHLGTIKERLLADERIAGRMLGLYEEILRNGSISADMSEEKVKLRLSGLVAKEDEKLVVYNLIYATIFERNWIEKKLANLRPKEYASAFNAWVSRGRDESLLLRDKHLEVALKWQEGRSLSAEDQEFILRSQELDRQDQQKANLILSSANRKAQKRILFGSAVLAVTLVAAVAATLQATNAWQRLTETDKKLDEATLNLQLADQRVQEKEGEARDAQAKTEMANKQLAATQSSLQKTTQNLESSQSNLKKTNQQLTTTESQLTSTEQQKRQAEQQLSSTKTQLTSTEQQKQQAEVARQRAEEGLVTANGKRKEAEQKERSAKIAAERADKDREQAEQKTRIAQAGTRLERAGSSALEQLQVDPVGALLNAMEVGSELNQLVKHHQIQYLNDYPAISPILALQTTLDQILDPPSFLRQNSGIYSLTFSPDGKHIATTSWNKAYIWNLDGQKLAVLQDHQDNIDSTFKIESLTFSEDGQYIAATTSWNKAYIWNLDGQKLAVLQKVNDHKTSLAFSPDGQRIVTASEDGTVRIWTLNGQELTVLQGHQYDGTSVAFSPDGQRIAIASKDKTVRIWSPDNQELVILEESQDELNDPSDGLPDFPSAPDMSLNNGVDRIAFSSDGQRILTMNSGEVHIWDIDDRELTILDSLSATLSPNGQYIALPDLDTVKILDSNGQEISVFESSLNTILDHPTFSPDGKHIATLSSDNTVRVWDLKGQELAVFQQPQRGTNLAFSPDGHRIAVSSGEENTAQIWNINGQDPVLLQAYPQNDFLSYLAKVNSLVFSPDGQLIATTSDATRIWTLNGQELAVLQGNRSVAFSPDNQRIATASGDGTARIWTLDGQELAVLQGHQDGIDSVAFSPDSQHIATASEDGTARIWNLNGQELAVLQGHQDGIDSVVFSPDEKHIATASEDGTVRVWTLDGRELTVLQGRQRGLIQRNTVFISPDGQRVATILDDGTARIWTLNGQEIAVLQGHKERIRSLVFSPDSQRVATVSYNGISRLWTLNGQELSVFRAQRDVRDLTFSPDGQRIATILDNGTARIWTLNGQELAILQDDRERIGLLVFSPDGQHVATVSNNGIPRLWQIETLDQLLTRGCQWLQAYLPYVGDVSETDKQVCADDNGITLVNQKRIKEDILP